MQLFCCTLHLTEIYFWWRKSFPRGSENLSELPFLPFLIPPQDGEIEDQFAYA
jgi:hypothetical protein